MHRWIDRVVAKGPSEPSVLRGGWLCVRFRGPAGIRFRARFERVRLIIAGTPGNRPNTPSGTLTLTSVSALNTLRSAARRVIAPGLARRVRGSLCRPRATRGTVHDLEFASRLPVSKVTIDRVQVEAKPRGIPLTGPPNFLDDLISRHSAQSSNSSSGVQRIGGSNPSSRHRRSMLGRI